MKELIIDKLLFLAMGIVFAVAVPYYAGPIFTIILEMGIIISWGCICWEVLALPLDLIKGPKNDTAYFLYIWNATKFEFYKNKYYCELEFLNSNNNKISLILPVAMTMEEFEKMEWPDKRRKIEIKYYQYSRILSEWQYK